MSISSSEDEEEQATKSPLRKRSKEDTVSPPPPKDMCKILRLLNVLQKGQEQTSLDLSAELKQRTATEIGKRNAAAAAASKDTEKIVIPLLAAPPTSLLLAHDVVELMVQNGKLETLIAAQTAYEKTTVTMRETYEAKLDTHISGRLKDHQASTEKQVDILTEVSADKSKQLATVMALLLPSAGSGGVGSSWGRTEGIQHQFSSDHQSKSGNSNQGGQQSGQQDAYNDQRGGGYNNNQSGFNQGGNTDQSGGGYNNNQSGFNQGGNNQRRGAGYNNNQSGFNQGGNNQRGGYDNQGRREGDY